MTREKRTGLLALFTVLCCAGATAQNFFKIQESPNKYFNQRIARFANGDLLITDSSAEAQIAGKNGKIFVTRMDPCGVVKWSNSYERTVEYLEFKDHLISEKDEIFIYGSAFVGLEELIFLLKLNDQGEIMRFYFFEPRTVDHLALSIDLKNGRLMAYGMLLGFNTRKLGFIAVFDENLNFQWGKNFTPFEAGGDAVISSDGGFICRSGPFLLKLDREGNPEWANSLESVTGLKLSAGPLEVPGGYVFGAHRDGQSFLFKTDHSGTLLWQTEKFPSKENTMAMSPLQDGRILVTYLSPESDGDQLCQLTAHPEGTVSRQQKLNLGRSFQTGALDLAPPDRENTVTLAGNKALFAGDPDAVSGFLMQFSPDDLTEDCFFWEDHPTASPNDISLILNRQDLPVSETFLRRQDAGSMTVNPFTLPFREICEVPPEGSFVQIDTLIPCGGGDWEVALPSPAFFWEDNAPDNPRVLSDAGIYRANNQNCVSPVTYEYRLERIACETCPAYLPNAFSPNNDGVNDRLEFFSDCDLVKVECSIFSRYGALVHESGDASNLWDGAYGSQPAQPGVYVAMIRFQWLDADGVMREEILSQDVVLVR